LQFTRALVPSPSPGPSRKREGSSLAGSPSPGPSRKREGSSLRLRLDALVRQRGEDEPVAEPAVVERHRRRRRVAADAAFVRDAQRPLGLAVHLPERARQEAAVRPALDDLLLAPDLAVLAVRERALEPDEPGALDVLQHVARRKRQLLGEVRLEVDLLAA